jgi:tRNA 5-methylaminomethyl-2-thiouridine biosynthesis bifunctional protein
VAAPDPSPIAFDADGQPRSRLYDDVYFSRAGGLAEARAVFLAGCGLPERWAGRRRFTVAELGFGTGLNVIALLQLWRAHRPQGGRLSIFSVEAYRLTADEARRALASWPELSDIAELLLARWLGARPGFHRVDLAELGATLDVAVMQAEEALTAWSGAADAWFLDGFAPAKNPAMWSEALMRQVAARSAPGAVAATYTVAGEVRRALAAAGFDVERRPGFAGKRQRLEARRRGAPRPERSPRVAIVGAGIAGASLARAFAALGAPARLFETERIGAGASGNPVALVTPRLDAGLGAPARLFAHAFARAVALYQSLPQALIHRGVLQLQAGPRDAARFAKIAASGLFEPGALVLLSADEVAARLGEATPAGLMIRDALTVEPAPILEAWAAGAEAASIQAVRPGARGWRLLDGAGAAIAEADVVCLAAGARLAALWPQAPVALVRGQQTWANGLAAPTAAAWGAYLTPMRGGVLFGATYDRGDAGAERRAGDDRRNLAGLRARLPQFAARLGAVELSGRAAVRAATADHLPIAGEIGPGLFVLGGLGSRGFTLAPLLAEHVAARALGAPSPLPLDLAAIVEPARFAERARRRGRLPLGDEPLFGLR